jgi:multiple sugar transport system permease protein
MSTAAATAPTSRRKHLTERARAERKLAYMLVAPAAIVMIAVTAYPVIATIVLSLQRADLRFPAANKFVGLSNYGHVLGSSVWWSVVWHTTLITVIAVSIQFVLGMLLALAMHRTTVVRG